MNAPHTQDAVAKPVTAPLRAFPPWVRRPWPTGRAFKEVKDLLDGAALHTVCQSAHCPNQAECWGRRTATVMVLGNVCTRHCAYCAVNSGHPAPPDPDEPQRIAQAVRRLGLRHMVLTTVTRDDLPDQGSGHIAKTIEAVKALNPETTIEALVQDFDQDHDCIRRVLDAGPEVFSHNIETVARLFPKLRDRRFSFAGALQTLRVAANAAPHTLIKSAFMVGCGETDEEVRATLCDLRDAGCVAVSMGQYLQPTRRHAPVVAFLPPDRFCAYEAMARDIGFPFAVAGPFVRSSYRSEALLEAPFAQAILAGRQG